MIRFSCKWCGKRYRTADRNGGRSKNCKKCHGPVRVPLNYLHFACKHCGKQFRTEPRYQGLTLPCSECGEPVTAPWDPNRPAARADAAQLAREHGPDFSPFELSVDPDKLQPLVGNLAIVPLDQLPPGGLPPVAEVVFDDDDDDIPDATPVAVAQTADGSLQLPLAELASLCDTPLAPSTPPGSKETKPPSVPPADNLPTTVRFSPGAQPAPLEPTPQCARCGGTGRKPVERRTLPGLIGMGVAALAGLACASMFDEHWLYGLAALVLFGLAAAASFWKKTATLCAGCGHRLA